MRALVTGGAGFIGSHLCRRLVAGGHEVVVIDNLSSGKRANVVPEAEFIEADVGDQSAYDSIPSQVDIVYHLASRVGQEASFEDPVEDLRVNALATATLLEWGARSGLQRLVFASSMNVYGNINPPSALVTESSAIDPPSPYAVGKLASEQLLSIYSRWAFPAVNLRLFNIYGPGQDLDNMRQGMVSIFLRFILDGAPVEVKGSLDRFRDFVFVNDVVDAFLVASREPASGTYNVATGVATTVRELVRQLIIASGSNPETYPVIERAPTRQDQFGVAGDSSRLRALGWRPGFDLAEGLAKMVGWELAQHRA